MTKKRGLGRGLNALIASDPMNAPSETQSGSVEVPIHEIEPNPHQPRQVMDEKQLQELANSIAEHGLIQPLVVTQVGENSYQIIAGERRWRASQLAGKAKVPVIIKECTPQQMLELALVENVQRADLSPLEEAEAYAQLMSEFNLIQEQVAERVGKSRTAIANTVRLLNLPDEAKTALSEGKISEGHARVLLSLNKRRAQHNLLATIIAKGLNVRQTESLARRLRTGTSQSKKTRQSLSPHDKAMVGHFEERLGTKVELRRSDENQGKLVIHFYSDEELQAVFEAILGEDEHL